MGTYLFPKAQVVSHALCREYLDTTGREGLEQMKSQSPEFEDVVLVLPDLIFEEGHLNIHLGGKTVRLQHCPGHSPDLISALVVNDRILFASDNMMPVPTIFDGSYDALVASLNGMLEMSLDTVVQGHGEVILRGEVESLIKSDLHYLEKIEKEVRKVIRKGKSTTSLQKVTIESCGKSRIPLNGFVSDLHQANLLRLYEHLTGTENGE
jgi:glyoxylase-like metal-dependent hydrolase (beta-lactamase superfamily II)